MRLPKRTAKTAILIACCLAGSWLVGRPCGSNLYGAEPTSVPAVPPGTIISDQPPSNWSHIVVKSQSTVAAGDLRKVPVNDIRMANKFNTVFLANVRQNSNGQYALTNLGVGCTVNINGQDTVIDPESHDRLRANLGFFEGVLLKAICKRQSKVSLVGYHSTIGIVDVPAAVRWKQTNQQMVIRYALLVDAGTGELHPLTWLINPEANSSENAFASNIQCLARNCIDNCTLFVDAQEYRFGKIPSDVAYAVTAIPSGTMELVPTKETRDLICQQAFNTQEVLDVERHLRTLHSQQTARLSNGR